MQENAEPDRLLDKRELRKLVPLDPRTLQRLEDEGLFPVRIKMTHARVGWSLQEVVAWIEWRKSERFEDMSDGQNNA